MDLSIAITKAFLRNFLKTAKAGNKTLLETLETAIADQIKIVNSGLYMTGAAQNGHSVNQTIPSIADGISPAKILSLYSELLDLYDSARAIAVAGGLQAPSDDVIFSAMMARLQPVKSFTPNFAATSYA